MPADPKKAADRLRCPSWFARTEPSIRPSVHDDLVQRQLSAQAANQVWLADITEHRTDEDKLHLCAIKDVYSNRIVGHSIDTRMKSTLAVAAPGSRSGAALTHCDDCSLRQG